MNGKRLVEFARATLIAAALALPTAQPAASVLEPRATLTTATGSLKAALEIDGKSRGYLRITDASGSVVERTKLVTHHQVIPLLIDRRLSPLWPALLDWAGPSLERLRARMLADSEAAFARGKKAYGEEIATHTFGRAGAAQERAILLAVAGAPDRAIALLQEMTSGWPQQKGWSKTEQGILITTLSGMLMERGQPDEADALLVRAPEQLGPGSHLLKIMATHGYQLAERARYQQALEVVNATAVQYRANEKTLSGMLGNIPGSDRYFAMTRSCALSGLRRPSDAQVALQPALKPGEPRTLAQKVPETNSEVRLRAALCLRDPDALAKEVVRDVSDDPISPAALILMQPKYKGGTYQRSVLAAARQRPGVIAALTPIARPLPPELVPALNDWAE